MMMNKSIMKYPSLPLFFFSFISLFLFHWLSKAAALAANTPLHHVTPCAISGPHLYTLVFRALPHKMANRPPGMTLNKSCLSVTSVNFRACSWYDNTNGCQMKRIMRGYVFVRLWQPHGPHTTAIHWKLWHWTSRRKKKIEKLPDWSVFSLCNRASNAVCVPLELSKCPVVCVCERVYDGSACLRYLCVFCQTTGEISTTALPLCWVT